MPISGGEEDVVFGQVEEDGGSVGCEPNRLVHELKSEPVWCRSTLLVPKEDQTIWLGVRLVHHPRGLEAMLVRL